MRGGDGSGGSVGPVAAWRGRVSAAKAPVAELSELRGRKIGACEAVTAVRGEKVRQIDGGGAWRASIGGEGGGGSVVGAGQSKRRSEEHEASREF